MIKYDAEIWKSHFEWVEGNIPHFYLDGVGIVTIGIGCVVFDASTLSMLLKRTHALATSEEIQRDYDAVLALPAGQSMDVYDAACETFAEEKTIDVLFTARLNETIDAIEQKLPLDSYPEQACLALVDMAFNLGVTGLFKKFPKFIDAFKRKDYATCANECHRNGIQDSRNEWTRDVFEELTLPF